MTVSRSKNRMAAGKAALFLALSISILSPGCGPATPEVDKAAEYSPESLAQELVFRYRSLNPESRKSTRKSVRKSKSEKSIADLERTEKASKKGQAAATTKARSAAPTIDDVLDDIGSKLDKIKGTPRAESCRQMTETITKDSSLTDLDKKLLSEKLKELGEGS